MIETAVRPKLEKKKLTLNKEIVQILTDREMLDVEGGTCNQRGSTCSSFPSQGCNTAVTCTC
jgi:hypothetical protein